MAPAELADLVKRSQVPQVACRVGFVKGEAFEVDGDGLGRHPGEKLAVIAWAVGAEVGEDGGKGGGWEGEG